LGEWEVAHLCFLRGPWQAAPPAVGQAQGPRRPGQLRSRAVFGAASHAWSWSEQLTEEQRENCRREAAKRRSRPRLGQSGPLTGQQGFVGRSCAKGRSEGEKAEGRRQNVEFRRQETTASSQVQQCQKVARSTWECCRGNAQVPRRQSGRGTGCARKTEGSRKKAEGGMQEREAISEVPQPQRVARSTWGRPKTALRPPCWHHDSALRVAGTLFAGCEELSWGIVGAGSKWLRQDRLGAAAAGLPGQGGSGGRERMARE